MTVLLDIIIALVVIEAGFIVWRRFTTGEAGELAGDLPNLASGLFLIVAVRIAWTNASALLVILLVTLAGAAHVLDMMRRFRSAGTKEKAPAFGAPAAASDPEPPH